VQNHIPLRDLGIQSKSLTSFQGVFNVIESTRRTLRCLVATATRDTGITSIDMATASFLTAETNTASGTEELRCVESLAHSERLHPDSKDWVLPGEAAAGAMPEGLLGAYWLRVQISRALSDRRAFCTDGGRYCIGPHWVEDGDHVVLLHGAKWPAVLRKTNETWQWVGFAYVNGVMQGEAWRKSEEEGRECDTFAIT